MPTARRAPGRLFEPAQYEFIYTVLNNSDAVTEWVDANGRVLRERTMDNSALVIQASGSSHRVRQVRRGERQILKMAFVDKDAKRVDGFEDYFKDMYA